MDIYLRICVGRYLEVFGVNTEGDKWEDGRNWVYIQLGMLPKMNVPAVGLRPYAVCIPSRRAWGNTFSLMQLRVKRAHQIKLYQILLKAAKMSGAVLTV